MDVLPVITVEGLGDPDLLAHAAQILLQDLPLTVKIQGIQRIELHAPLDGVLLQCIYFFIVVAVFQPCFQLL